MKAKIIKEYRKVLGISQKQIARIIGVSENAVSLWERGKSDVPVMALAIVSRLVSEKAGTPVPVSICLCWAHKGVTHD